MKNEKSKKIQAIIETIDAIIQAAHKRTKAYKKQLKSVHPDLQLSAKNLLHYKTMRSKDMRQLHKKLGNLGMSR